MECPFAHGVVNGANVVMGGARCALQSRTEEQSQERTLDEPEIQLSETRGVRFLHFGEDSVQGAMHIKRPWELVLPYTQDMMFPLLLRADDWPKKVLLIGLGAGSLLKFLLRFRPACEVTAVEISAQVLACAQQYFQVPRSHPRVKLVVDCGAAWLANNDVCFDAIFVDGFDCYGHTGVLENADFYRLAEQHLCPDGLMVANLLNYPDTLQAVGTALNEVFAERMTIFQPCESGNLMALAAKDPHPPLPLRHLFARSLALQAVSSLDLSEFIARHDWGVQELCGVCCE